MRKIIIDTDTGSDDAIALLMALSDKETEVLALTTVFGNVSLSQATRNALISCEIAGAQVPVYPGMERPLVRDRIEATHVHGSDGLGDAGILDPKAKAEQKHAVSALIDIIAEHDDIELITLGPLTNVALAMRKAPEVLKRLKKIVCMGGAQLGYAAETEVAEFNVLADPEAAKIVFEFGVPLVMVPLEVCLNGDGREGAETILNESDLASIKAIPTHKSEFLLEISSALMKFHERYFGDVGLELPDPCAVAVALKPELILHAYPANVTVDTSGFLSYGQTVVNTKGGTVLEDQIYVANVSIVSAIEGKGFKAMIKEALQ